LLPPLFSGVAMTPEISTQGILFPLRDRLYAESISYFRLSRDVKKFSGEREREMCYEGNLLFLQRKRGYFMVHLRGKE
jgi:hypothetical protein